MASVQPILHLKKSQLTFDGYDNVIKADSKKYMSGVILDYLGGKSLNSNSIFHKKISDRRNTFFGGIGNGKKIVEIFGPNPKIAVAQIIFYNDEEHTKFVNFYLNLVLTFEKIIIDSYKQ